MIATLNTNLMGIINQVLNRPSHSRVPWFSLVGEDSAAKLTEYVGDVCGVFPVIQRMQDVLCTLKWETRM